MSEASSLLKIGRKQSSSNRSGGKEDNQKQVGGAKGMKARTKKAMEKEAAKVKRALYRKSASNESEMISPDFGGNIMQKKGARESPNNTTLK